MRSKRLSRARKKVFFDSNAGGIKWIEDADDDERFVGLAMPPQSNHYLAEKERERERNPQIHQNKRRVGE